MSSSSKDFKKNIEVMDNQKGKLYIVATPIGNLGDITFRALDVLREVDLIAAEDTRHTKELLNHFDIKKDLTSYHEHNKYEKAEEIVKKIIDGKKVAIVTDAGTPIISDPGNELVKLAIIHDIDITAIPGACACINALVLSGLDAKGFVFVGFLPENKKDKLNVLNELKNESRTMVFYISPHDLMKDMNVVIDTFGEERIASLSREMTKKYEETKRASLKEIREYYENKEIKGEFVLVVDGKSKKLLLEEEVKKWEQFTIEEHVKYYIDEGIDEKDAMKKVAIDRGISKREVYKVLKVGNF